MTAQTRRHRADATPPYRLPDWIAAYDAVIFDCDGVLLDSNDLKVQLFKSVLLDAGFDATSVAAFSEHQTQNFGLSRHRLFDLLLESAFGDVPPGASKALLLEAFGRASAQGYLDVDETEGMAEVVTLLAARRPLYVASGSDEAELVEMFARRDLAKHFARIYGSPTAKYDNIRRVREDLSGRGIPSPRLLFVGDAEADADAAERQEIDFLFIARHSKVRSRMSERASARGHRQVETLADLLVFIGHDAE